MSLLKETFGDDTPEQQHKKRLIQVITGAIESLEMKDDPALIAKVNRLVRAHLGGRIVKSMANKTEDLEALLKGLKKLNETE